MTLGIVVMSEHRQASALTPGGVLEPLWFAVVVESGDALGLGLVGVRLGIEIGF